MSDYIIPESLMEASIKKRISWLLQDAKSDALMGGHPRYQPRYTEREQQIIHLLRWSLELVPSPPEGSDA